MDFACRKAKKRTQKFSPLAAMATNIQRVSSAILLCTYTVVMVIMVIMRLEK